jgi:hypothetical protein
MTKKTSGPVEPRSRPRDRLVARAPAARGGPSRPGGRPGSSRVAGRGTSHHGAHYIVHFRVAWFACSMGLCACPMAVGPVWGAAPGAPHDATDANAQADSSESRRPPQCRAACARCFSAFCYAASAVATWCMAAYFSHARPGPRTATESDQVCADRKALFALSTGNLHAASVHAAPTFTRHRHGRKAVYLPGVKSVGLPLKRPPSCILLGSLRSCACSAMVRM